MVHLLSFTQFYEDLASVVWGRGYDGAGSVAPRDGEVRLHWLIR